MQKQGEGKGENLESSNYKYFLSTKVFQPSPKGVTGTKTTCYERIGKKKNCPLMNRVGGWDIGLFKSEMVLID